MSWKAGPFTPRLSRECVDVWLVDLDESSLTDLSSSVLSLDELDRASRFRFEADRLYFARCRVALRCLLSQYLQIAAAKLRFEYKPCGKPELVWPVNRGHLQFNVSHCGNLALIAIGAEHDLGIDIEKVRDGVDTTALAERFFSPRERAGLRALPEHLRNSAFFACWTRKEAYLKAIGDGLSFPLEDFSVTVHPELDAAVEEVRGDGKAGRRWSLIDLGNVEGHCATVAIDASLSCMETYEYVTFS